jgi:hypothetical protein
LLTSLLKCFKQTIHYEVFGFEDGNVWLAQTREGVKMKR